MAADPFRHHPALRGVITPFAESFFRDFDPASMAGMLRENGVITDWFYETTEREALRREELAGRLDRDLWVFGYGSLCWDPALDFDEVRHARLPGYARRFVLKDTKGARGTLDRPGVMAGLAEGTGCDGLAFRVPAERVDAETRNLWARERIAPAYLSRFLPAETRHGEIEVLAFLADPSAEDIDLTLSFEDQVRYAATGEGFLGSSADYVRKLKDGLAAVEIADPFVDRLLDALEAHDE